MKRIDKTTWNIIGQVRFQVEILFAYVFIYFYYSSMGMATGGARVCLPRIFKKSPVTFQDSRCKEFLQKQSVWKNRKWG